MDKSKISLGIFTAAIITALALALVTLSPYFDVLIFASIFAIVFYPLFKKLKKMLKADAVAALLVVLILALLVIAPLAFFGVKIFQEALDIYSRLAQGGTAAGAASSALENIRLFLPGPFSGFSADINSYLKIVLDWMVGNLGGIFSGAFLGIASFILFFFAFFYLVKDGEKFISAFHSYSPLPDELDNEIFRKIQQAVGSVVKGSLAVAIIQGIVMGVGFGVFGVSNAFFWGSVSAVAALIPAVGTGIVFVPAVAYLFFTGQNFAAIGILVWGSLIVGTMDNFLKPYLIGRGAKVPGLLVLFSVLGGLEVFGFVGFLLGPVIMAVLFALLETYPMIFKKSD